MKRTKKNSPPPVTSNRAGIRRVSRSTVVATSATIAADKRLAALLGEDEPASPPGAAPEASSPDRDKLGRRRGVNGRAKGKAGELEFKDLLRENGWPEARRGQQRSGVDQADVIDGPVGVHWEVKRVENLNVWKAAEQAERDAPAGSIPVVAMRRNRSRWLAVLPIEHLLRLIQQDGRADKALDALLS